MEPKDKAKEIFNKFYGIPLYLRTVKQCCHIAVDNAMDALRFLPYGLDYLQQIEYWEEVKKEIEKL
jgi:hypothetical protein